MTMHWIRIHDQGLIPADRIVAVGRAESAAARRLLGAVPLERIVGLTAGRRRQSIIILDSGHVVLTGLAVGEIEALLAKADSK
jgi:regulator of extracellular matrix RemA (YlzA/DUF370 family)